MDIRHTITRFGATALIGCGLVVTAIPATFAQNGEESVTYVYADKAASHISEVWYKGEALKITGEGFLTQDGTSGSTIAIKLNKGTVKIDGKDYLEVQADEKGNFSVSIPWQDDLDERISVDVYLLSGSLKDNDTARGGKAATVKIKARSVQEATPSATASASASASATASVVATPSASVAPSASATASASGADEVIASVDAEIKGRLLRLLQRAPRLPHRLPLLWWLPPSLRHLLLLRLLPRLLSRLLPRLLLIRTHPLRMMRRISRVIPLPLLNR